VPELQGGIYWDKGQHPPRHFAIAFLRATQGSNATDVREVLVALTALWRDLARGTVPDLPGAAIPPGNLAWLIAFGRKTFELNGANRNIPARLRSPNMMASVLPGGGGPAVDGSGIMYASDLVTNPATEEIAVQFTGDTPLSVTRAIVETWTLLERMRDPQSGRAPLMLAASFIGFNREDHRSWIGFHDGISNMVSGEERRSAIAVKPTGLPANDRWTEGGTYLAFMRLAVDLRLWATHSQSTQEQLVGRTKIYGCPLRDISGDGEPVPKDGCPLAGTSEVTEPGNEAHREPPDGVSGALSVSHVQRANHHQSTPDRRQSQRFFRQGYEYFEPPVPGRPLQVGLNFVSFQEHPERLLKTLNRHLWLGGTNFGGAPGPALITCYAAGIYLCPPEDGEAFPGASIFPPATS